MAARVISPEYAAGFFDGEGSVGIVRPIRKNKRGGISKFFQLRVQIENTDLEILALFQTQFGGGLSSHGKPQYPNHKPAYKFWLAGKGAADFLKYIYDFVRVKKSRVGLALEFWNFTRKPKDERMYRAVGHPPWRMKPESTDIQDSYYVRLKDMNRRGNNGQNN